jgi:leucine dehydrogenase
MNALEHEEVLVRRGSRSGLPVIVAVHSTALGQAVGGCRIWPYPSWRDGLDDALRLSAAMTFKCALAGLAAGGGKSVIPLAPGSLLAGALRRDVLLDLGDAVDSLSGRYGTAEDVGTTALDMLVVRERTPHVFCLPESHGGIGELSEPTAAGVVTALRVVCAEAFGSAELAGRRFAVHGLGQVGGRLARRLAAAGARLVVGDIDETKRDVAAELGAEWVPPPELLGVQADVLVPASLGGLLTAEVAQRLQCAAVAGPANNQLATGDVAGILAARGILWAPDTVVNAGGAIYGVLRELRGQTHEAAMERVGRIGDTLTEIFAAARGDGLTPHEAALRLARRRVADARARRS